jgi:hypothetical protein
MASWEHIRNKVVSKLEAITQINEVLEFPSEEFTKFPVAMLETVRNESDYETTTQNKRTYVFSIYILQDIESVEMKKARRIIQDAVDAVLDAFDNDQQLSGIDMPTNEAMVITIPTLSRIFTNIDGKYVVGEIELKVITSFSIS